MNYCGPQGIPWHEFVGWPQVSRDAALLWQAHRDASCARCGTHPDDWDPEQGGHRHAYVATAVGCSGCRAIANREKRVPEGGLPAGQSIALRRQVPHGWTDSALPEGAEQAEDEGG